MANNRLNSNNHHSKTVKSIDTRRKTATYKQNPRNDVLDGDNLYRGERFLSNNVNLHSSAS